MGFVNITVEGFFVERFINICKSKGIFLWNVKMKKGVLLYASIGINDYKNIRTIAKKTGTRIRIKKKCGIPFILNKYKKRKIFAGHKHILSGAAALIVAVALALGGKSLLIVSLGSSAAVLLADFLLKAIF